MSASQHSAAGRGRSRCHRGRSRFRTRPMAFHAKITKNAAVTSDAVTVEANQPVSVDMIGASAGVGLGAGVGVSTVVAMLRSNVLAASTGSITAANVTVSAKSRSGNAYRGDDAEGRKSTVKSLLQDAVSALDSDEGEADYYLSGPTVQSKGITY